MNPRDFCYWLRGYMELCETNSEEVFQGCDRLGYKSLGQFSNKQWQMIKEHLEEVMDWLYENPGVLY